MILYRHICKSWLSVSKFLIIVYAILSASVVIAQEVTSKEGAGCVNLNNEFVKKNIKERTLCNERINEETAIVYYVDTLVRYYVDTLVRYYFDTVVRYYDDTVVRYYDDTVIRAMQQDSSYLKYLHRNLKGFFLINKTGPENKLIIGPDKIKTGSGQQGIAFYKKISFGLNGNYGFFIANQPKSLLLRQNHAAMAEINVAWQTSGSREWEVAADHPAIGIALIYGDAGSKQYIGSVTALYPFIHFPLIRKNSAVTSFRLGTGIGYVQKPYDKNSNFKNLMIGTNLNATISMRLQTEWKIAQNLSGNAGINFTHLSNGSIRLPNLGLNIPGISVGLRYGHAGPVVPFDKKRIVPAKESSIYIHAAGALKQTYPLESAVVVVPVITGEWVKRVGQVSRINAGAVFSYDRSLRQEIPNLPTYEFVNTDLRFQASIFGGYEHVVGRLSIPLHVGVYVYNNYPVNAVYQVIGVRYRFPDRWVTSVQLKTHFGKADYIQYGIGYRL